ncbi:hypothetical protein [Mesobacillus selenatarsenatis]|uniref:Uncharacterized protein n=1 Tax=Mesobacillus selenatarsenatis (strain DSM 18680 / JCM 14380 / FERM P-15431 / SF-1) TaxID=1321606 RepID=A0A0A8X3F8_MESS1|nr:hypothetical protein [Mesobacillus selenatarsenatis]GAM14505.1 hypothetical protein SAMD00020551_2656 [Mesobacillus selenatarsenatis SF-1]
MKNKNNYLDQRGDFTAPPEGAADYPKKPEHKKIEKRNTRK